MMYNDVKKDHPFKYCYIKTLQKDFFIQLHRRHLVFANLAHARTNFTSVALYYTAQKQETVLKCYLSFNCTNELNMENELSRNATNKKYRNTKSTNTFVIDNLNGLALFIPKNIKFNRSEDPFVVIIVICVFFKQPEW